MELVEKTDDQGNTIIFKRYKGRSFAKEIPGNVGDQLDTVASLQCRPDDVLLCTFPKSGTHWVFNMARMIQTKTLRYSGTPKIIEFDNIGVFDKMPSPRMFATHLTYPFIPKAAMEGKLKLIYVLRNPKDVVCSYYTYMCNIERTSYIGNFDGFLKAFLTEEYISCGGSWFTHTREWNAAMSENPNLKILFLRFEDLKKNLFQNILRIADFLEVDYDETFLRNVERTVTFENLKKVHATSAGENKDLKHLGDKERLPIYNKGVIGEWKNVFTNEQNNLFDAVHKEKITDMGVDLDFVYE